MRARRGYRRHFVAIESGRPRLPCSLAGLACSDRFQEGVHVRRSERPAETLQRANTYAVHAAPELSRKIRRSDALIPPSDAGLFSASQYLRQTRAMLALPKPADMSKQKRTGCCKQGCSDNPDFALFKKLV